jgi:hypothetical protein
MMGIKSSINPTPALGVRCLPRPGFGPAFSGYLGFSNFNVGKKRGENLRKNQKTSGIYIPYAASLGGCTPP